MTDPQPTPAQTAPAPAAPAAPTAPAMPPVPTVGQLPPMPGVPAGQVAASVAPVPVPVPAAAQPMGFGAAGLPVPFLSRPGAKSMLIGFGIALVGLIATVVTFAVAAPGGGFVVAWGAILFGVIQGIRGLVQALRY